jgi:hypothetical protein
MSSVVISGNTSGTITLDAPAVAGTTTLTLPATSGTVIVNSGAQTIEFADGSAGAPSITNSGDTNTGMFFPAADTIAFAEGGAEAMRIDSSGDVMINTTDNQTGKMCLAFDGSVKFGLILDNTSAIGAGQFAVRFRQNGSFVGSIQTTATNTFYVTSSDYRLKDNIVPMTGALATVAALKPVTYKWKIDGSDGQGFIAHELQAIVPNCVTGEKDAVDENGNIKPQGIDTSFLVATLTAAIQELKAELDNVKTELATLKGAPQ